MNSEEKIKIVIICDNKTRDLTYQLYLKQVLEKKIHANVYIIGSLAEYQRMMYLLYKIQPNIVILPQIQEQCCRDIAAYVKESGGIVCIIPSELAYTTSESMGDFFNTKVSYDKIIDFFFLPGEQMYDDVKKLTDISIQKMVITGSPKMDVLLQKNKFYSRKKLCEKFGIPLHRKNIFIFTNFIVIPIEYMKVDPAYREKLSVMDEFTKKTIQMKNEYLRMVKEIADSFKEHNVIVKPHPLEDASSYNFNRSNIYIISREQIYNLLDAIDIAIHANSTVATECWQKKIKTIQYVPIREYNSFLNDFYKGNPVSATVDNLKDTLIYYLANPMDKKYVNYQKEYISRWYFGAKGNSSKRICSYILKHIHIKKLEVFYKKKFDKRIVFILFLEKIFGVLFSRLVISMFQRNFNRKYAIENYVYFE